MPSLTNTTTPTSLVRLPLGAAASAVLGLRWYPQRPPKPHPKAHQLLLQQSDCNHWLLHQVGDGYHYGLAAIPVETEPLYSATLHLIDQLGSDWVAIVQLPNHTYGFIGVSKGQVVPGCELVLATAAEALEQFTLYQALFQWPTVYAPSPLNLGGEPLAIESLLAACAPKAAYQLQYEAVEKQTRVQWIRYGVVGGLVLLLSTAGFWLYTQHHAALRLAQQRRLQAQRQKQAAPVLPVWCQHPPAQLLLTHCMQAITRYPLFLRGWRLETAQCDRHSAKASYRWQSPHTVKGLLAGLQCDNSAYEFSSGAKVVHLQQALNLPKNRPQEPLPPMIDLASDLLQQLEQGIATGRIDDVFSTKKQSAYFELESVQTPLVLLQKLSLAGVVIHTLQTTINPDGSLRWKCSGTLYGQ
ncbi:type 4b pilus protein PilO2 [unidentified bacterial endosymbiont]|uniref:type 4b pilus protein PilO2 n=1 Tax=unidentified bacterial endosymbiont TaxID=2355 RepID=UPI00209F80A9|nr:type 4b pilus protein PilO2 [unidentified bacterial endosymbiont]